MPTIGYSGKVPFKLLLGSDDQKYPGNTPVIVPQMKYLVILSLVFCTTLYAAESKYEDNPLELPIEIEALLEPLSKRALDSLDHFEKELKDPRGRSFYLITRIYEGDLYEQVFVLIESKEDDTYHGKIVSEPMGPVNFQANDPVSLQKHNVVDWLIVNQDGTEEGNLLGKAVDLLQVGMAAFICEWQPKDGSFETFKIVSVRNPQTNQEVMELAPQDVIERVEKHVGKEIKGKEAEDDAPKYGYTLVTYPDWEIVVQ